MHIHAHGVAEAVREEESVSTGGHSGIHIALHQTEGFETFGHQAAHGKVYVHVAHAGAGFGEGQVVAVHHDVVDVALPLGVGARDGRGASVVGTIALAGFTTGIYEEQAPLFEWAR